MMNTHKSQAYLNRALRQCLSVGSLTTLSLLLGWAPYISGRFPTLVFASSAYAQAGFSDGEVYKFAKAGYEVELRRQEAYSKIKAAIGRVPPDIDCSQSSMPAIPDNAKAIAVQFCRDSQNIVSNSGLDIPRFNQIAVAKQSDSGLNQRIQKAVSCVQNGVPAGKCF